MTPLWLALHLPYLPLEVFRRGTPGVAAGSPGSADAMAVCAGSRVLLPDAAALRQGLRPGMALSAARALVPDLLALPRDTALESSTLEGLALWAGQFSPMCSLAPPDGLLLEVGGCLRLFGGLDALLARVRAGLPALGFDAVAACAPTPGGARLLARCGLETCAPDLDTLAVQVSRLPLEALEVAPAVLEGLQNLGVRTLGECLNLPRDGLARRFGRELPDQLDRALGRQPDPQPPFVPPVRFSSRLVLPVPVPSVEPLLFGTRRLAEELSGFLASRQAGAAALRLSLVHESGPATEVDLSLTMPSRDAAHLVALLRERLSRLCLRAPVEAVVLSCDRSLQLAPRHFSLFAGSEDGAVPRAELVERLRARLGREAVHGLVLVPEHRPELAFREAEPGTPCPPPPAGRRPLWLLAEPKPVAVAGLQLLEGPERIETGWWDGPEVRRDYHVASTADGARVWVYLEHGTGDGPGRWFLHGLFA